MSATKILVILGDSLTALAVARDARARGMKAYVVSDESGPALASRAASPVTVSRQADGATLQTICNLALDGSAALIATSDDWVRFVVTHREVLAERFNVLHASNRTLQICLDKSAFAEWCVDCGLDAPRHWAGSRARETKEMSFPVLLRPATTLHSVGSPSLPKALEIADAAALARWLDEYDAAGVPPLVTESMLGQHLTQFSIPLARAADGTCESFVARKMRPPARFCRVGTYVELCPDERAEALARSAAEALDYRGIGEAEVLYSADTGKYFLIEINARPWLQYALAPASGHDLLGTALGDRARSSPPPVKRGVRWIDFRSDLYVCFSRSEGMYAQGELGLVEYLKSIPSANVYAKFSWSDPLPFVTDAAALCRDALARFLPSAMKKA